MKVKTFFASAVLWFKGVVKILERWPRSKLKIVLASKFEKCGSLVFFIEMYTDRILRSY